MAFALSAKYVTKSVAVASTDSAAPNDLYVCPNNFVCLVRFLHLSNRSANNKKVTVYWYEASTSTHHYIVDDFSAAANSMHEVIEGGGYLALNPGDKLQCFAETTLTYQLTMSGEEHFQPA